MRTEKSFPLNLEMLGLPYDYDNLFRGNTLFITGTVRAGTTLLGKILGSLEPVIYVHEPVFLRTLPIFYRYNEALREQYALQLKIILFEDFILQIMHGRTVNFNDLDLSYIGNYARVEDVKKRWSKYRRRSDVIEYLKNNKVLFVIKMPELQPILPELKNIFPDALFLHTVRDGKNMVNSGIKRRGWFSDNFFNEQLLDWVHEDPDGGCNIPWFIDADSKKYFRQWNEETRSACIWRVQNENGLQFCSENAGQCLSIKHEDFIASPEKHLGDFMEFVERKFKLMLSGTEITKRNIESIADYDYQIYPPVLDLIEEPERSKFISLMAKFSYEL